MLGKAIFAIDLSADNNIIFASSIDRSIRSFSRDMNETSAVKMHSHIVSIKSLNNRVYGGAVNGTTVSWNDDGSRIPFVHDIHANSAVLDILPLNNGMVVSVSEKNGLIVSHENNEIVSRLAGAFHKLAQLDSDLLICLSKTNSSFIYSLSTSQFKVLPALTEVPCTSIIILQDTNSALVGQRDGAVVYAKFISEEDKLPSWQVEAVQGAVNGGDCVASMALLRATKQLVVAYSNGKMAKFSLNLSLNEDQAKNDSSTDEPSVTISPTFIFRQGFDDFRTSPNPSQSQQQKLSPPRGQSLSPNRRNDKAPSANTPSPNGRSPSAAAAAAYGFSPGKGNSPNKYGGAASYYGFGVSHVAGRPSWDGRHQLTFSRDNKLFHPLLRDYFDRPRDFVCGPSGGQVALNVQMAKTVREESFAVSHGHHAAVARVNNNGSGPLTSSTFFMEPSNVNDRAELRRLACGLPSQESLAGFLTTDQSRHATGGLAYDHRGKAVYWNDRFQLSPSRDNDHLNPLVREYFDSESPLRTRFAHWDVKQV